MTFSYLKHNINQIDNDYLLVIVYPEDGWILEKIATAISYGFRQSLLFEYQRNDWAEFLDNCKKINPRIIIYYVNYNLFKGESDYLDGAWFTHLEMDEFRANKLYEVAGNVNFGFFQNSGLASALQSLVERRFIIPPGVDPDYFPIFKVGVVGRDYDYTTRKNVALVDAVSKSIKNVEVVYSGGTLSRAELLSFYRSLDATFIASTIEGGPMSFHESLSVGCPVIIGEGVGYAADFAHLPGVFTFQHDDFSSLVSVFHELKKTRDQLSAGVQDVSWNAFVVGHHLNFTKWCGEYY